MRRCKGQPNWQPSRWSSICNKHFLPTDFKVQKGLLRKHLKPDAVPTIELVHSTDTETTKATPRTVIPQNISTNHIFRVDNSTNGTQCRLCAQVITNESTGVNILNFHHLLEWTQKYLHLTILSTDALTKSVCLYCYQQLEQFNMFSEKALLCQQSLANHRMSLDLPRAVKIKQEPNLVNIKEEAVIQNLNANSSENTEDFANNLSSLLSDYCLSGYSGHIMEITDLTNDFINLTGDDNNFESDARVTADIEEVNIKPNLVSLRNNNQFPGILFKQEDLGAIGQKSTPPLNDSLDCCDEDDLSKAMISNEHSYCKYNSIAQNLDGNNLIRLIKTEEKEELPGQKTVNAKVTANAAPPLVSVPKIYIIDNALIKHNCDKCGELFETRSGLIDHQHRIHERFQCDRCMMRFEKYTAFYFHKLNCSYRKGYLLMPARRYWRCSNCLLYFKLEMGLKNHEKRGTCKKLQNLRHKSDLRRRWKDCQPVDCQGDHVDLDNKSSRAEKLEVCK